MILLKKWWVRFIFSLIVVALLSEAIALMTNGEIRFNGFLVGMGLYLILSVVYGFILRNQDTHK